MRAVLIRRIVLSLCLAPLLVSCGGDQDPGQQPNDDATSAESSDEGGDERGDEGGDEAADGGGDACSVLSAEEVAEAVGTEVGDGVGTSSPVATGGTQTTCVWAGVENAAATATLTVYTDASAADSVRADDSAPVPELGDDAFVGSFASVWAYAGEGSFMTQWYDFGGSDEENLPKSVALATLVADRL